MTDSEMFGDEVAPDTFDQTVPLPSPYISSDGSQPSAADEDVLALLSDHKALSVSSFDFDFSGLQNVVGGVSGAIVRAGADTFANLQYFGGKTLMSSVNMLRRPALLAMPGVGVASAIAMSPIGEKAENLGDFLASNEALASLQQKLSTIQEKASLGADQESFAYQVGAGLGSVGTQVVGMVINPALRQPMLLSAAGASYRDTKARYLDELADLPDWQKELFSTARASGSALLTYGTEMMGVDAIVRPMGTAMKKYIGAVIARGATGSLAEGAENVIQSLGEQVMDMPLTGEGIDLQRVAIEGAVGLIAGGAAGTTYAAMAHRQLMTQIGTLANKSGVQMTSQELSQAAMDVLGGVTVDMTSVIMSKAQIDPRTVAMLNATENRLRGMQTETDGISQEDIARFTAQKKRYDTIVDQVVKQLPTTKDTTQTVQPQDAAEIAMRLKTMDQEIMSALRLYGRISKKKDAPSKAVEAVKKHIETLLDDAGLVGEQRASLLNLLSGSGSDEDGLLPVDVLRDMSTRENDVLGRIEALTRRSYEKAETLEAQAIKDKIDKLLSDEDLLSSQKDEILSGLEGESADFSVLDAKTAETVKTLAKEIKAAGLTVSRLEKRQYATAQKAQHSAVGRDKAAIRDMVKSAKDKDTLVATGVNPERVGAIENISMRLDKLATKLGDMSVEARAKAGITKDDLEYLQHRLLAIENAVYKDFAAREAELSAEDKQTLKELELAAEDALEQAIKLTKKAYKTEEREGKESTAIATKISSELKALVRTLTSKYEATIKQAKKLTKKSYRIEAKEQAAFDRQLSDLIDAYDALEQERSDVLAGKQTQGKINTTMNAVRRLRYKELKQRLQDVKAAGKATKSELQYAISAVRRLVKRLPLQTEAKKALLADLSKPMNYESLMAKAPEIYAKIDEALAQEQVKAARNWLARAIRKLATSPSAKENLLSREILKALRHGDRTFVKPYGDVRDDYLNQAAYIGNNPDSVSAEYLISYARNVNELVEKGIAGREAAVKHKTQMEAARAEDVRKHLGREALVDPTAIRGTEEHEGRIKKTSGILGIQDLYRSLELLGKQTAQTFDIQIPYSKFVQGFTQAEAKVTALVEKAYSGFSANEVADVQEADEAQRSVVLNHKDDEGNPTTVYVTPAQATKIYLMSQQSDVRRSMIRSTDKNRAPQFYEETLDSVDEWINKPENARHKQIAEGLRKILDEYPERIRAVMAEVYPNEYFDAKEAYFMTARMFNDSEFVPTIALPGEQLPNNSKDIFENSLKRRLPGSNLDYKITSPLRDMHSYIRNMEHYLAYAKYVHDLKTTLNQTRGVIERKYGEVFFNRMDEAVNFLRDGMRMRQLIDANGALDKFQRTTVKALIRGGTQVVKQISSIYMSDVDKKYLHKSLPLVIDAVRATGKDILSVNDTTDPILAGLMGTAEHDYRYGFDEMSTHTRSAYDKDQTVAKRIKEMTWNHRLNVFPRLGDQIAWLTVAHAKTKELMAKGVGVEEAMAKGIREAEMSQQTNNPARMPTVVIAGRGIPMLNTSLALTSTNMQAFNRYMAGFNDFTDSLSKAKTNAEKINVIKTKGVDHFLRWHFMVPLAYMMAASGMAAGVKEYLKRMILGPSGDLPLAGEALGHGYDACMNLIATLSGDKYWRAEYGREKTENLVLSVLGQAKRKFEKAIKSFEDGDGNEWWNLAEASAFVGALKTGIPLHELEKVVSNLAQNGYDDTIGIVPWMMAIAGYTKKRIDTMKGDTENG